MAGQRGRFGREYCAGLLAMLGCGMWLAGCKLLPQPPQGRTPVEQRGRHLLRIAEGCSCHGLNFAGWRSGGPDLLPRAAPYGERFAGDFGVIPAPNITPDQETGIGDWSDEQIRAALQLGVRPNGRRLHPLMPYREYHGMADDEMDALIAYLRRLRPVRNQVPPAQLKEAPPAMTSLPPPEPRPAERVALGRYLTEHVCGCVNCHSPAAAGSPQPALLFAGNLLHEGPEQTIIVPNITPDRVTGIGTWSERDIAGYLRTGSRPDGGLAQSLMSGLILVSFSHFTDEEARAVAAYLKSVPPVRRDPRASVPPPLKRSR